MKIYNLSRHPYLWVDGWVNGWPHVKPLKSNKSIPNRDNSIMDILDILLDILLKLPQPFIGLFLMCTQMSMEVISDHVCGNVCLFVMMIYGGDLRCEPFWCEPIGSWFGMMDVIRYLYWFCLCVCVSVDLACQMVMMVNLWLPLCGMVLDQLCFWITSSPFEKLQCMICHEPSLL